MPMNFGEYEVDPQTGEYHQVKPGRGNKPPRPPKEPKKPKKARSRGGSLGLSLIITLVFGLIYFYFELPAINVRSFDLYIFIMLLCLVFCVCNLLFSGFRGTGAGSYVAEVRRRSAVPFYVICACLAVMVVGSLIGWKVVRARSYAEIMPITEGNFTDDVAEISFDQIPMLDATSANVLANRKLGELSDLVSQFEVFRDSYQINYKDRPVRVTYLYYGDVFKWLNNQRQGIPAYMIIDMVTQEVSVERVDGGIKYSPSEYFFRNINRHLRLHFPTMIFDDINFEIDDEGTPYWVATTLTKKVGLFGGADANGAVLVNAVTGESTFYAIEDVPNWVDRVYSADLLLEQYDYYGIYKNGYINSIFGQSDCAQVTNYYNYIAQDDDVWVYSGVTSVSGDQGNIGFILVNQRTKDARYYPCAGAEEGSAMNSAQGAVQQYAYQATSPLLLNIGGQPTYFMALKDNSQLVKMYAMVNVQQYQIVATGTSVTACLANYEALLAENNIIDETNILVPQETETVRGLIAEIRSAVINGNTVYFIRLENSDVFYSISAGTEESAVLLDLGERVSIEYLPSEETIKTAVSLG